MAVGPLARIIAQVIVPVVAVLARALPAAYAQALQNAKKSGAATTTSTESMQQMLRKTITRQESLQILNLNEETATAEAIQKQYERYMASNDVKNGGSFYLQSKIYRAREMLMEFQEEKRREEQQHQQ